MQGYKDIEISYSTEQEIPKTLEGFKKLAKTGSFDALAMVPALNQMLKPKKQEERKETIEIVWTESKHKSFFDRINRYATYLEHAKNKYKDQRTFLYETRRPFYDFFVCNDIKRRISTPLTETVYYSSGKDNPLITDACIEKFPQDHHFIILSGTGGLGKSMMMIPEHLWNGLGMGYTMDGFRKAVKAAMDSSAVSEPEEGGWYRVRKSWADAKSQKRAFKVLANARKCADENPGYSVYDESGKAVYSSPGSGNGFSPYLVQVSITDLNIRKGPGTNYGKTGKYTGKGVFTIVEEAAGQGASCWGKLKSGAGWISLDYAKRI